MKNTDVSKELHRIASESPKGLLTAKQVVDAARPVKSPLHAQFEWDDSVAGEKYRLEQARQMIRMVVSYVDTGKKEIEARVFVSLSSDRRSPKGGYRTMVSVMTDEEMHAQMLDDALAELSAFRAKYARLRELDSVFDAIRVAQGTLTKKVCRSVMHPA